MSTHTCNPVYPTEALKAAARVSAAFASRSGVSQEDTARVFESIYTQALHLLTNAATTRALVVSLEDSVTPDYIVCLEDGAKVKMLKRHLAARHGMTIEDYRKKWGLPRDYPTTAPNYSKKRSQLAKDSGLGLGAKFSA